MKKMLLMTSLVAASATLFTGCATLFGGGGTQQINIQSKKDTTVNVYKVSGEETKGTIFDSIKFKSTCICKC